MPLGDLYQILLPMFLSLSHSALHSLLQYYGISKKLKELQQKPQRSKFKSYEIHTILTDNSLQFSYRALLKDKQTNKAHPFDKIYNDSNTEHRLTKFAYPWMNGQVKKINHIIKSATLKLFHYGSIDEYLKHLTKFLNYYNYEKKLKSLKFKSNYDKILEVYQKKLIYFWVILHIIVWD